MNMLEKIVKYVLHPKFILIKLDRIGLIHLEDQKYIEINYERVFEKKIDLDNPKTFNEKIQWLKLNDRNPFYTQLVDKYEVKKYISKVLGEQYVIPTLGVYEKFDDIDFEKLPNQFVIKCTHDSGGLVIVNDKTKFNIKKARKKINNSLRRNYYYVGREWPYKDVKPRIIIEQYMSGLDDSDLIDYKIMCYNGIPKNLFTCTERYTSDSLKVTFFDMDWNRLPFERHYKSSNKMIEKPKNYEKIIEFSKILSKNIPFVRVDWYEVKSQLYFGEMTFYPGCGLEEFSPEEWDLKLGDMINLGVIKK